jgi:hypothetical protein
MEINLFRNKNIFIKISYFLTFYNEIQFEPTVEGLDNVKVERKFAVLEIKLTKSPTE